MPTLKPQYIQEPPTLEYGTGTPYLAIFNDSLQPIVNPLTGINLGAYIESFQYVFQEGEKRSRGQDSPGNEATLVFRSGNPDSLDIPELQKNSPIYLQFGYIFSNGRALCSNVIFTVIREISATLNQEGVSITLKTKDTVSALRYLPPFSPIRDDDNLLNYLANGCDANVGVLIKKFK